ncbi:hypothetical protein M5G07_04125 [Serratia symbiotica]|nr:hypothetical protein [Serratia symbiotica]
MVTGQTGRDEEEFTIVNSAEEEQIIEAWAVFSGMPTAGASTDVDLVFAAAMPDALCDT